MDDFSFAVIRHQNRRKKIPTAGSDELDPSTVQRLADDVTLGAQ
jgi:hypothetical protein